MNSEKTIKNNKIPNAIKTLGMTSFRRTVWVPIIWSVLMIVLTVMMTDSYSYSYYNRINPYSFAELAEELNELMPMYIISIIFSVLFGAMQFSFLTKVNSVGFIHSLPVTRNGIFTAYYVSGVISVLIPQIILALTVLMIPWKYKFLFALLVLVVGVIYSVGVYSFAVMMSMFAANALGGIVFAGFFLAVPAIIEAFLRTVMDQSLYGYYIDTYNWFIQYLYLIPQTVMLDFGWLYYLIATVIFAALAFLLYKKHPSETAGDLIAFPKIRAIATIICGILAGFCGYLVFGRSFIYFGIFGSICAVLVNFAIKKKFSFASSAAYTGVICIVAFAIYGTFAFDLTGFVHRIPEKTEIENIIVNEGYHRRGLESIYINGNQYYVPNEPIKIKDGDGVDKVIELHKDLIGNRDYHYYGYVETATSAYGSPYYDPGDSENIIIEYTLKNGKKLIREYRAYYNRNRDTLEAVLSLPEMKMQEHPILRADAMAFRADILGTVENVFLDEDEARMLEDAITRDILTFGKDDVRKLYGYRAAPILRVRFDYKYEKVCNADGKTVSSELFRDWEDNNIVWIYPEFTETLAALRSLGHENLIDFNEIPSHYLISIEKHHSKDGINTDVYHPIYVYDEAFLSKLMQYSFNASAQKLDISDNTAYRIAIENKNKESVSDITIYGKVDFIEEFISAQNPEKDENASYKGVPYRVRDYDKLAPETFLID